MTLATGQILQQRYHIISHIGQGGMGTVYQAQDTRLNNRFVAVKEFDPAQLPLSDRQTALQAFQQEAAILAKLSHPGLTAVYDYFLENNKFYLVMEYVEGETMLQAWERVGGRFDEAQTLTWTQELCGVLNYLHNQQPPIIFRDLKPGNIMVQPDGRLKLIDFGIARHFTPGKTSDTVKFGTPGYAAPEQYGQGQTDARSDIYALGVVTHQLLTGHDPTSTPFHLPPITQLAPYVSSPVNGAVSQALEMDPNKRPFSVQTFSQALQAKHAPTIKAASQKSAMPIWGWGLIAGLVLLLLVGGGWLWQKSKPEPPVIIQETVVVTQLAASPTDDNAAERATERLSPTAKAASPTRKPTSTPVSTVAASATPRPTQTTQPSATPPPTEAKTAVTAYRPTQSQTNLTSIWQGIVFQDMRSPGTNRYTTTLSANDTRRWSFIWCGRTRDDLENIVAPLTVSMLLNGEAIPDSEILQHDQVVDGWQCRYWSTLLTDWVSGETVEVEAYYQLAERIYDGDNYYEPGTYRQIITVRVR